MPEKPGNQNGLNVFSGLKVFSKIRIKKEFRWARHASPLRKIALSVIFENSFLFRKTLARNQKLPRIIEKIRLFFPWA
jgi:hypothetical protein